MSTWLQYIVDFWLIHLQQLFSSRNLNRTNIQDEQHPQQLLISTSYTEFMIFLNFASSTIYHTVFFQANKIEIRQYETAECKWKIMKIPQKIYSIYWPSIISIQWFPYNNFHTIISSMEIETNNEFFKTWHSSRQ